MMRTACSVWCVLLCLGWLTASAYAQNQAGGITLQIDTQHVGLGATIRPGEFVPMRVELTNQTSQPRQVRCQWIVADVDGDQVHWQRTVTLTPGRTQPTWLYAAVPINTAEQDTWRIDVIDEATSRVLATQRLTVRQVVSPHTNLIGLTSAADLGLGVYEQPITQHEPVRTIRSLNPADLPDRWHGLASLSALIWTPNTTGPSDAAVSLETQQAIRQWVRRGGHLVIVLPGAGQTWTSSPLADLLPDISLGRVRIQPPWFLGAYSDPQAQRLPTIDAMSLEPRQADADVAVLLRGGPGRDLPLVVAHQVGFGRVTVVGVDITDPRLLAARLPNGAGLWGTIFTWRSPAIEPGQLQQAVDDRLFSDPLFRPRRIELIAFIPGLIAMSRTAAWALVTAVVFFGLYWAVAGPLPMAILKHRQRPQHSWLVFSVVVLAFAAVAWGGALLLRPGTPAVEHFSVMDVDRASGQVRVQSWASVFVPRHDDVLMRLGEPDEPAGQQAGQTLKATGILPHAEDAVFIDTQRYTMAATQPDHASIPIRATPKQVELHYQAAARQLGQTLAHDWVMPDVTMAWQDGFWVGTMTHGLPAAVRDITIIYSPGQGRMPMAWRHPTAQWQPGEALALQRPDPQRVSRLPLGFAPNAHKDNQSRLGSLMRLKPGQDIDPDHPFRTRLSRDRWIPLVELLSFFSALPPPDYEFDSRHEAISYARAAGRHLDISHLLSLRRLIVIGLMEDAPLPAPLQVDGQTLPSTGWVVVRWIITLPPPPDLQPQQNPDQEMEQNEAFEP